MGLCLFLALNDELSQGKLNLIVMDDVMMSVDTGHRKDVCRLLRDAFGERQLLITTHDKTWAKQLKQERVVDTEGLIEFTGWSVEGGPTVHQQLALWEDIEADLARDDVAQAAFKLRKGSEEFFEAVCDALGAAVTYDSKMQWQLDDWLPAAMEQYKKLLGRARSAARSWGLQEITAELDEANSIRKQIFDRTFIEQWAINASVHYNNWENMSHEDFSSVVDAFKDLQGLFLCSACGAFLERLPKKGSPGVVKCRCGTTSWNLEAKAAE